jgi:oligosaccharide repeat unit polymerase
MILLAISGLLLLAIGNYWIGKRFLYPPVVFCAVWAADLSLVLLAGPLFYPLSNPTLAIFAWGAVAFSAGSLAALLVPPGNHEDTELSKVSNTVLTLMVFALACSIPFAYRWIVELTADINVATLIMAARAALLEADQSGARTTTVFENLVILSIIVAVVSFVERATSRKRAFAAIVIALVLNLLSGARSGIVTVALAVICIDGIAHRGLRWKPLLIVLAIFVCLFGVTAIMLQAGEARVNASISENIGPVVDDLVSYAAGGIVAFDQVVRQPSIVVHNWQITKFFLETFNKMGGHFEVMGQHAEFVNIGPNLTQNIYTMYFAYIDLGYVGIGLIMLLLGFVLAYVHRNAVAGDRFYVVVYSCLFAGLVLSPFGEMFFMSLNTLVKVFAVSWLLFRLPGLISRWSLAWV